MFESHWQLLCIFSQADGDCVDIYTDLPIQCQFFEGSTIKWHIQKGTIIRGNYMHI